MADTTAGYPDVLPLPEGEPRRIGRYTVLGELARGGMGVVFRAREAELDREVALKVLLRPDPDPRFLQEARAAARLEHPGIVRVHHMGEDHAGRTYLVMELVPGESLNARLKRDGPLPLDEALRVSLALCDAIAYAHDQGVIHRDLKPHNVLLTPDGQVKITDFGLGKVIDQSQSLTVSGEIMGTPAYMPPEQAAGDKLAMGPTSDVYGLGATVYALLTGRPPFQAPSALNLLNAVLSKPPQPPSTLRRDVLPDLDAAVMRCLAKDPTERYPSAAALATALRGCAPAGDAAPTSPAALRLAVGVVALGLIAAAALVVYRAPDAGVAAEHATPAPGPPEATPADVPRSDLPDPTRAEADAHALRALDLLSREEYPQVVAAFDRVIALDPQRAHAWASRSLAHLQLNNEAFARRDAERALELDPRQPEAWTTLAALDARLGDLERAVEHYTRAIELEPGHAAYWRFRGELHMRAGDPERALADCRAAERLLALRGGAPRSLLDLIARLEAELAGGR